MPGQGQALRIGVGVGVLVAILLTLAAVIYLIFMWRRGRLGDEACCCGLRGLFGGSSSKGRHATCEWPEWKATSQRELETAFAADIEGAQCVPDLLLMAPCKSRLLRPCPCTALLVNHHGTERAQSDLPPVRCMHPRVTRRTAGCRQ